MENNSVKRIPVTKVLHETSTSVFDELAVEEPLAITLTYFRDGISIQKDISVTMRTPGDDKDLAVGFLFTEGIIENPQQLAAVHSSLTENKVMVVMNENAWPRLPSTDRNFYTSSSCGVCGKSGIESIHTVSPFRHIMDSLLIDVGLLYGLEQQLHNRQEVFKSTGGLHASALFNSQGKIELLREDVGRHNALDKLIGNNFMQGNLPLNDHLLLLSGRASFELVQKAQMAGIKIIAAIGAPSTLAVQLAGESGITLIGFLKKKGFNIYCGKQRIKI